MRSGSRAEEIEKWERSGKDQVNIETLKAGDETIAKQLAKNFSPISALLMTYSYAQKHHNNYNICYKNYPMKVGEMVLR